MKWHATVEAMADQADNTVGFLDATEGSDETFSHETPSNDALPQSHLERRQHLMRKTKSHAKHTGTHLLVASTLFALDRKSFAAIIDSGENVFGLAREEPSWAAPFNIETPITCWKQMLQIGMSQTCPKQLSTT